MLRLLWKSIRAFSRSQQSWLVGCLLACFFWLGCKANTQVVNRKKVAEATSEKDERSQTFKVPAGESKTVKTDNLRLDVPSGAFDFEMEFNISLDDGFDVDDDYEVRSNFILLTLTKNGSVVASSQLKKDIKLTLNAEEVDDESRLLILAKPGPGSDSSAIVPLSYEELTISDQGNATFKVMFGHRYPNMIFVVVERKAAATSTPSPSSDPDDDNDPPDTTPPSVNVGSNISATSTASINATASDADSGIQTYLWSKVSGPGVVTFGTGSAEDTTVSADTDGTYVIRLTVTDQAGNSASDDFTLTWDANEPPPLTSLTATTGASWDLVDLELDFPNTTTDYDNIKIYRSAGVAVSPATAPACGAGTLIATLTDFSVDPYEMTDDTNDPGKYFQYTACIYDDLGNETSQSLAASVQSKPQQTPSLVLDAADMNGDGTPNSGAIDGSSTASAWSDVIGTNDGTLTGFPANGDANAGWKGAGSVADPYRLHFDGSDSVSVPAFAAAAYSMWFKGDDMNLASSRYLMYKNISTRMLILQGSLQVRYNAGTPYTIGVVENEWYHVVMTSDGTTRRFYLNGVEFASEAGGTDPSTVMTLGSAGAGGYLDGQIGDFRAYASGLTENEVRQLYLSMRTRYYTPPASISATQVFGTVSALAGGTNLLVRGWNLDDVTGVTIGGTAATFTTDTSGFLSATVPAGASAPSTANIVLTDGVTPLTLTSAYRYTDTNASNLISLLDPRHVDSLGAAGTNPNRTWVPGQGTTQSALHEFAGTTSSGWAGAGTTADPYRLEFDGVDDFVFLPVQSARTIAVWFRADTMTTSARYIYTRSTTQARLYSGMLEARYNGGSWISYPIVVGGWHQFVMTNDNATTRFYFDGVEVTSTSGTVETATSGSLGDPAATAFDGAIGEFRTYSTTLTQSQIRDLYIKQRGLFITDPGVLVVSRVYNVISGGGASTMEVSGYGFDNAPTATIGGQVAAPTVESEAFMTLAVPVLGSGAHQIEITDGTTTETHNSAFFSSTSLLSNLNFIFDAQNLNGLGSKGAAVTSQIWTSLKGAARAAAPNIASPSNASSGFKGTGTTADPYRLHFDGSNDYLNAGTSAFQTISLWFNADTSSAHNRFIFARGSTAAYINSSVLNVRYNGGTYRTQTIATSQWYHLAITFDGTTAKYFLNGVQFYSEAKTLEAAGNLFIGGTPPTFNSEFDGAVAEIRGYSSALTAQEIVDLYRFDRPRFPDLTHSVFVTTNTYNGAGVVSLEDADLQCLAAAATASRVGAWKAILSNSTTDAVDRIVVSGALYNTRGAGAGGPELVAASEADLWDTGSAVLNAEFTYTESGGSPVEPGVWTGTNADGTYDGSACSDWTSSSNGVFGRTGTHALINTQWIDNNSTTCDSIAHLYCIEQR